MRELTCFMCAKTLNGGTDTYGDIGEELCRECYNTLMDDVGYDGETWYGMAPHEHIPFDTGGKLKGHITQLVDYSNNEQDSNGWYRIAGDLWFRPDAETDGAMGVWEYRG